jgi:hypothetical protein
MIRGVGAAIVIVVFLRKLKDASNSFSNSLLFCFCSKILTSFVVGSREANSYT